MTEKRGGGGRNYRAELESGGCVDGHGCNAAKICICALAEDMADEIDRLRAAGRAIIAADDEFRATLGPHWDGDPVSDACEAARDLFCLTKATTSEEVR